jgi:hypothetical protein
LPLAIDVPPIDRQERIRGLDCSSPTVNQWLRPAAEAPLDGSALSAHGETRESRRRGTESGPIHDGQARKAPQRRQLGVMEGIAVAMIERGVRVVCGDCRPPESASS